MERLMLRRVLLFVTLLALTQPSFAADVVNPQTNASQLTTGTLPVARQPLASLTAQPSNNSTSSTGTPGTMIGSGGTCTITPGYSGRLLIVFSGTVNNGAGSQSLTTQLRYGTGTAPANGAAATGTAIGAAMPVTSFASSNEGFFVQSIVTGLTVGTAYWIDVAGYSQSGTTSYGNMTCSAVEY